MRRCDRSKSRGVPAEGACMKGIGALKPQQDEPALKARLEALNLRLSEITIKDGKGKPDPEGTLNARAEEARKMLEEEPHLAETVRFSIISQKLEERLF
jgi:hypothetical protein